MIVTTETSTYTITVSASAPELRNVVTSLALARRHLGASNLHAYCLDDPCPSCRLLGAIEKCLGDGS